MAGTSSEPPPTGLPGRSIDWRRIHIWQIQPVRDLLVIAAVIGLVYLGSRISLVTVPVLLALLLAYLFEPLIARVTRSGHLSRRGVVVAIIAAVLLTVCVPVTVGGGYAIVSGVNFVGKLAGNIRQVLKSVENPEDERLRGQIRGEAWRDIRDYLAERRVMGREPADESDLELLPEQQGPPVPPEFAELALGSPQDSSARFLKNVMTWVEQNASSLASTIGKSALGGGAQAVAIVLATFTSIGAVVFTLFLTMFFFFFFSTSWGRVLNWGQQFIPRAEKYRWTKIVRNMDRAIAGFVRGRLTIAAIIGLYMTIAFWIIGAPVPLLLGPLVGVLFLVPFAAAIAVPFVMLMLWLQAEGDGFRSQWWWILLAPIGVHIGGQILDDYILTPKIQGDNTDMSMPMILFASIAGGVLGGIYGLLLAIPVAACLKILAKEFLWPRIDAWVKGEARDPLPISRE
jgi:predicted PurR-regulated permease PerM